MELTNFYIAEVQAFLDFKMQFVIRKNVQFFFLQKNVPLWLHKVSVQWAHNIYWGLTCYLSIQWRKKETTKQNRILWWCLCKRRPFSYAVVSVARITMYIRPAKWIQLICLNKISNKNQWKWLKIWAPWCVLFYTKKKQPTSEKKISKRRPRRLRIPDANKKYLYLYHRGSCSYISIKQLSNCDTCTAHS